MLVFEKLELREVLSTFTLHSNPGADHTIYLDFDGHVTEGTIWNQVTGIPSIVTPPYDTDGEPATFGSAELAAIEEIFARVAEDFLPLDVDVTTEDPGVDALTNSGDGDTQWGQRVAIGGDSSDWYPTGVVGVARFCSFSAFTVDTPAFVFSEDLESTGAKGIAETASHETGHGLCLGHDGQITPHEQYYGGHGTHFTPTSWGPIMGSVRQRILTQWNPGDYPNANNQQDDLAIMTDGRHGFGYRADDHGDSRNQATPLDASMMANGIITTRDDVDYFSFSTGGGDLTITALPAPVGPNLDIGIKLYRNGKFVAESNPLDELTATLQVSVGPGKYFIEIDGVGRPETPDHLGYSDYGSLGEYTVSVSGSASAAKGKEPPGRSLR